MNQKKNAFTLIELLAVIVILAIIALIAVPVIMNIINKANKSAFKDTAYGIINAGELYFAERQLEPLGMLEDVTILLPDTTKTLELKGDVPQGEILITKEGKIAIFIKNSRYCVTKGINDTDVTITENYETCKIPNGNSDSSIPDTSGPVINLDQELSSNIDNPTMVGNDSYTLSGSVSDESGIASLTVNGTVVTVNADGTWSTDISLTQGEITEVPVVATDNKGNVTTKVGYIKYGALIGYSYNGVVLPGQDFDPVTYEYVLYKHDTANIYYMRRSAANQKYICDSEGNVGHTAYATMSQVATKWSSDDYWTSYGGMYPGYVLLENLLWSYNDILYEDGTVAFTGSEPVPVYE